jgi:lipoprotein-releasing system ATP-binding protein
VEILSCHNIFKTYKDVEVLKGVSLSVQQTEIVSIVGSSGAGKSTLLHILGTLDKPDNGEISIKALNPKTLNNKKLAQFRNQNIGFVFQFHNLLPELSAQENVMLPGIIAGESKQKCKERASELLDKLGLSHRLQNKPYQLSGGEQQRVSVARAIYHNPSIVLADEPSGNLDSKNAQDLHQLFFKLREDLGLTFVIVTHNEGLANISDRKIVMKDGKILEL